VRPAHASTMNENINILIADDHPIFRSGLRQVLDAAAGMQVIAEASDGIEAMAQLHKTSPQVAILDVNMPNKDGFALAREIKEQQLPVELIFLTMYTEERFFNAAIDLGVKGYLLKDSAVTEVIHCIKTVAAGDNFISPVLSTYLVNRSRRRNELHQEVPALAELTFAERRVLKFLAEGKNSPQIAAELNLSVRTIQHHRANIADKLDLKGSNALLQFALRYLPEL
jgi:DNA-binding NarL/FixJ family response regulator